MTRHNTMPVGHAGGNRSPGAAACNHMGDVKKHISSVLKGGGGNILLTENLYINAVELSGAVMLIYGRRLSMRSSLIMVSLE